MTDLFKKNIEFLTKTLGISKSEVFDFLGTAGEEEYLESYNFYQEALAKHADYGVSPSYFYFKDSSDFNAKARKTKDNFYLIEINKGITEFFYRCLVTYFDLDNFDKLNKYKILESKLQNPIGELMYQSIMHFTFYHELGHLIQFTESSEKDLNESLISGCKYSVEEHCEELDADLFASISVSTHIYQYFEKYFNGQPNKDSIESYISILTSSIFIYFLSFAEYRNGYYLKENSHPHPLVRIISATARITDYFEHLLKMKGIEIKIDQNEIFKETFRISEIFVNRFIEEKEFEGFFNLLTEKMEEIKIYYDELISLIKVNPNYSVNRRNDMIKNN